MDRSLLPVWRSNLCVCVFGSFSTVFAMTLMMPFLPVYVGQLGITNHAAVMRWAGVAYSAPFLGAAIATPLWGRLSDLYGRKKMLLRASLGMSIATTVTGLVDHVWQLVAIRFASGLVGGYSSGALILVAVQTPGAKVGWALGTLSSGIMAANLVGPLMGGLLPRVVGVRGTFMIAGALIFITFAATAFLVREPSSAERREDRRATMRWRDLPNPVVVVAMLITAGLLTLANMSIEPIITLYVGELHVATADVTTMAGLVMSAGALGSILSASRLGMLADRVGHLRIVTLGLAAAALLLIPQIAVTTAWQLAGLRLLMGVALGGLLPCIAAVVRLSVPDGMAGALLGYSLSCQYAGQIIGPLMGGMIGAHFGLRAVFLITSLLLGLGALTAWKARGAIR